MNAHLRVWRDGLNAWRWTLRIPKFHGVRRVILLEHKGSAYPERGPAIRHAKRVAQELNLEIHTKRIDELWPQERSPHKHDPGNKVGDPNFCRRCWDEQKVWCMPDNPRGRPRQIPCPACVEEEES